MGADHNDGQKKRVLSGWTLRDPQKHVYRFLTFALKHGASVRVHTEGVRLRQHPFWRMD